MKLDIGLCLDLWLTKNISPGIFLVLPLILALRLSLEVTTFIYLSLEVVAVANLWAIMVYAKHILVSKIKEKV